MSSPYFPVSRSVAVAGLNHEKGGEEMTVLGTAPGCFYWPDDARKCDHCGCATWSESASVPPPEEGR